MDNFLLRMHDLDVLNTYKAACNPNLERNIVKGFSLDLRDNTMPVEFYLLMATATKKNGAQ